MIRNALILSAGIFLGYFYSDLIDDALNNIKDNPGESQ